MVVFPTSPENFTYTTSGNYTASINIANNISGSLAVSCNVNVLISNIPMDGVCGFNASLYDFNNSGDMLSGGNP